eukprot:3065530-Amphidinium_carterae.2
MCKILATCIATVFANAMGAHVVVMAPGAFMECAETPCSGGRACSWWAQCWGQQVQAVVSWILAQRQQPHCLCAFSAL